MSGDETGLYAFPLSPSAPMSELRIGYPDDYSDPPWDGSEEQFREVVLPARLEALRRSFDQLDQLFAPLAPDGILAYDMVLSTWPDDAEARTSLRERIPRAIKCYRLASGSMVHIKPDCRCRRG